MTWLLNNLLTVVLLAVPLALVLTWWFYFTSAGRRLRYRMVRKQVARLSAEHEAEVLMRVVAGPPGELGTRWRLGRGLISPGRLDFTGYVGGIPFLKRRPLSFQIVAISAARPPLRGREKYWGDPDFRIVALTTPGATVELAVPPPFGPDLVFARLGSD